MIFAVRTEGDPAALAASFRGAVNAADPALPVFDVMTMGQRMDNAAQPRRAPAVLISVLGGIAVILAVLGVYGVMAFTVAQRTLEFGVRMALGATPGDIARLVLGKGIVLAAAGVSAGLAGYLLLNRLVASLLFGIAPTDPLMLTLAPLALAAVVLAACLVPALGATRIEPIAALRQD
jgi:ABC-type antimicrobial peptide transport system permease subunit